MEKMLSKEIIALRNIYINEGKASSIEEINHGICFQFAEDVTRKFYSLIEIEELNTDMFKTFIEEQEDWQGNEDWDLKKLEKWNINPPDDCNKLSSNYFYHVWIYYNGKHYDSECPYGTENFFDLPVFKRFTAT